MIRHNKQTIREKRNAVKQLFISTGFRVGLLVCAVVLLVLDVVQVSAISTKGYDISDYQRQIQELEREHERIQLEIAKHRSMKSIEERIKRLQLVDAEQPQFTRLTDTAVARR